MNWPTKDFSAALWESTASIRAEIAALPLLTELADGTLEPHRFVEYLVQDDFYLRGYAKALAGLASRAPSSQAAAFWARGAGEAVAAESAMHASLMADPRLASLPRAQTASPTTRAYVSMIQASVAFEPYGVGVAAVLPCYWVYAEVGLDLTARASHLEGHPYRAWVESYGDPIFQTSAHTAIELLDEAAEGSDAQTREAMAEVFIAATWYEKQFWARSYAGEAWPFATA